MTQNYHTAIATGAAANASTFNTALGALDSGLTNTSTIASATASEVTTARSGYGTLGARLDALVLAGGNVATLTNGAANAAQKVVTVDSSTGLIDGAYVAYSLVGGAVEYNVIDSIDGATQVTLTTNIGTGGIADNTYLAMISPSEVAAANAINHGTTDLTLPQAMAYAAGGVYNVMAYGAVGDGTTDDTAALQAAFDAADDAGGGAVLFQAGKTYKVNAYAGGVDIYSNTRVIGNGAKIYMAGDFATLANGAASAGQKVVTVDSTAGMHAGDYVQYALSSSAETNVIDTVDSPTQVTLTTSIGGTGIPNNGTFGLYYPAGGAANEVCAFSIDDDQTNVEVSSLEIYGDNSPYVAYGNLQSNGIWIGNTAATANIWIHHCLIRNLYGFPLHQAGGARRVSVTDNVIIECANGINVCADYGITARNFLLTTEGIENSGIQSVVSDNVIYNCAKGISMGGSASSPGMLCDGNVISDTTVGEGIATGDGSEDCRITNNIITRTYGAGIIAVVSDGTGGFGDCRNLTIANNTIRSAGFDVAGNEANQLGIYVIGQAGPTRMTNVTIAGNRIAYDAADTDHATRVGITAISVDGITIEGNAIAGTMSAQDINAQGCANVILGRNTCNPAAVYFASNTYGTQMATHYTPVGPWIQDNVAASQSAVALTLVGGERTEIPMVRPGDIVGIALASNEYRAAGTLTVAATKNGTALSGAGLTVVLNSSAGSGQTFVAFPGVQFAAGDLLGVKITTDGSWGPTTADITVSVLVVTR